MTERTLERWIPFGEMVRRARLEQGLTHRDLGPQARCSHGLISKIERAKRAPNRDTAELLDSVLELDGKLMRRWESIVRAQASPSWFARTKEYEERAREIRFFHPLVIPGFFQTPEYSELVVADTVPGITNGRIKTVLEARRSWRERLRVEDGLILNVVIPELVLNAARHQPDVMRGQIDRLLDEAEARSTTIQVLPATSRDLTWACGPFRLIYLRDADTLLCVEHSVGEHISDDEEEVGDMEAAFSKLQTWALPPDASRTMMKEYRESL